MKVTRLFVIIIIIFLPVLNALISTYIVQTNPTADLVKYIDGLSEFGNSYFEPFSLIYFSSVGLFSEVTGFTWLLSFVSTLVVLKYIFSTENCFSIKIFFVVTLGLVIPLINVRYASVLLVYMVFPYKYFKYLAMLSHWNFIVMMVPAFNKRVVVSLVLLLTILCVPYFFGLYDFIIFKVLYYIEYNDVEYSYGLFFELVCVSIIYYRVCNRCGVSFLMLWFMSGMALIFTMYGYPVISSRLMVLSFIVFSIKLYDVKIKRLDVITNFFIFIVCAYELYRIISMF